MIVSALKKKLEAEVELAKSDLQVFLTNPIGIFQIMVQKLLPFINMLRGILPI